MNKPSSIQLALNKLHEAMEGMAKDAKGWKVSDILALNGVTKEIIKIKKELAESQQELATLKASLPKIKADAVRLAISECKYNGADGQGWEGDLEQYANKLEAGE